MIMYSSYSKKNIHTYMERCMLFHETCAGLPRKNRISNTNRNFIYINTTLHKIYQFSKAFLNSFQLIPDIPRLMFIIFTNLFKKNLFLLPSLIKFYSADGFKFP